MRSRVRTGLHYLLATLLAAPFLLPLYWAVVASLHAPGLPPARTIEWWPAAPHWENYAEIFRLIPLERYLLNSLLVVAVAVPATLLTASLAGFGMSQLRGGAGRRLAMWSILLLLVPGTAVWVLRFQIMQRLGLVDTLWALVVPAFAASNPLFVLLFYWTYRRVPQEVYESARIDGAEAGAVWWRIAQPLAWPTSAAVAILAFVLYWSDFTAPLLYLYRPDLYTMPIGLEILRQMDPTNWPLLMAGAVLMALPIVLLLLALQRLLGGDLSLRSLVDRD